MSLDALTVEDRRRAWLRAVDLKDGLRRWWDPNQDFLVKVAPRVPQGTQRVGRGDGALARV
jgi:hypothetical protein